mgnify:CR=1 FL=1
MQWILISIYRGLSDKGFCTMMQCGVQVSSKCIIPLLDEQKQVLLKFLVCNHFAALSLCCCVIITEFAR